MLNITNHQGNERSLTQVRMAIIKRTQITSVDEVVQEQEQRILLCKSKESLYIVGGNIN